MSDALAAGRRTSPPGPHKKSLLASLALPVNAVNLPRRLEIAVDNKLSSFMRPLLLWWFGSVASVTRPGHGFAVGR